MHDAPNAGNRPRQLSPLGKGILLLLLLYAVVVIAPDTLRPVAFYEYFYHLLGWTPKGHWYPLGTLCFTADNDGIVTDTGNCGSTSPLHEGDQIDLKATAESDRRAVVFGGGWVAHGRAVTLEVRKANGDQKVQLMPTDEVLRFFGKSWPKTWTLIADQIAGFSFIGLSALCVWRDPERVTWGFFLYALWYNSGQIAIMYANLSAEALQWFERLQAVLSGAGLTGLLMFALHFPSEEATRRRRPADSWLVIPFVILTAANLWSLRSLTEGVPTERVNYAYYYLVLATFLTVFALFVYTYVTQPKDRPRIRWVILGALTGLLCYVIADIYTETSMLNAITMPTWLWQALYAVNGLFALAVWYAILHHRVINVRLVLNRSMVLLASIAMFYFVAGAVENAFHEQTTRAPWIAVIGGIVFLLAHERLRGITDVVDWLFYRRRYVAESDLKKAAQHLANATQIEKVNYTLIDLPTSALDVTAAALFERRSDEGFQRVHATTRWPQAFLPAIPPDHPLLSSLKDVPVRVPDRYWKDSIRPAYPVQVPVLAVPILIGRLLSRIALFGPHTNDETFDPDERRIISKLAQSAAIAYATLEAEEAEQLRLRRM